MLALQPQALISELPKGKVAHSCCWVPHPSNTQDDPTLCPPIAWSSWSLQEAASAIIISECMHALQAPRAQPQVVNQPGLTRFPNPRWRRKQTQLDSILGQAANIRLHAWSPSQWTLNFVPSVYRSGISMGNQIPGDKRASGLGLGLSVA